MKNETYILTGKTVEEAMASARSQYGSSDNELSFEILEMPTKGFLGFGAKPAKIKVTVTKTLEEVHLSDLVSELKSMKLSTDTTGEDSHRKSDKPKQNSQKQKQQTPQKDQPKQQQKPQNQPKQNPPKQQNNTAPAPQKPKQEQKKPAAKPAPSEAKSVKEEIKSEVRETVREIKEEIKETVEEVKEEIKEIKEEVTGKDESDLPAALRTPVKKNQNQQKKPQKKSNPKSQNNKSGDEKKKDLLSAVMGVADAPKKESPAVTVTPTVMKPKADPAPAAEEIKPESTPVISETSRSVADAVDAALAAFAAEEPAPLPEGAEDSAESKEIPVEFVSPEKLGLALSFVNTLLKNMHLEAEAVPATTGAEAPEDAAEGVVEARVEITGRDTGLLIGHHGETLDAIQTLMNLAANRRDSEGRRDYVKIVLDMADYRRKREETLRTLARRTAARVVKYKRNIVLEPMNPYERRVIHSELHNVENVSTHSVGSDENRKIVITYEGADKVIRPKRGERRRRGDKPEGAKSESPKAEKSAKSERPPRGDRPAKPARAKSIDEVQIDLSTESNKTFGSIQMDEGIETGTDPIEAIAKADEEKEENLREY